MEGDGTAIETLCSSVWATVAGRRTRSDTRENEMPVEIAELDKMQAAYKAAVEQWIASIRAEEALAAGNHSEAEVDAWEAAGFREEEARNAAKEAKEQYEDALREKFFNF
jgi:hypothetical protein